MYRIVIASLLVGCVMLVAVPVQAGPAEQAAEAFAAGNALLAKAEFDAALQAFRDAAKTDAGNQEYAQQYALLRQVVKMRGDCQTEQDAEEWLKMAGALRTFYYDHQLYAEALPLDQERHRRRPSTESAVLLAETQLALGMDSEAVALLGSLTEEQASPWTSVLHGLALARLGRIDEAKKLAEEPRQVTDDVGPRYFYDLARLQVLVGHPDSTLAALTKSFELTPPSRLDAFKAQVKASKDFGAFASSNYFAMALETPSKVKESRCSKGAGCGKCPSRSKCSGKHSHDKDDKEGH